MKEDNDIKKSDDKNRTDRFTWNEGEMQIGNSQCDFCIHNVNNEYLIPCSKYPEGKPDRVLKGEIRCKFFDAGNILL